MGHIAGVRSIETRPHTFLLTRAVNGGQAAVMAIRTGSFMTVAVALVQCVAMAQTNSPHLDEVEIAPAVSALNGKLSYLGGDMNSAEGHNVDGSLALPIGKNFGFQADGLYSSIGGLDFFGGAGHLFWRKPEFGLIGVAGGYLSRDGVDTFQVGAEGEYYWGPVTLGVFVGVGSIRYDSPAPFIDSEPTAFVGRVSVDWYALEDLRVGVSYSSAFDNNLVKGEVEYQTPLRGLAVTGEVAKGDHGYDHWLVGVRYYFGSKKSLRERHRTDDPRSLMPQLLHALGTYGAEFNRKAAAFFANQPGVPIGGGHYGVIATMNYGFGLESYQPSLSGSLSGNSLSGFVSSTMTAAPSDAIEQLFAP